MNILRKALSPVVAVALLLVVAVVAVVMFSTWFDSFRTSLFTAAETKTSESQTVDIIDLVGEDLFFQAGTNTSVSSVKVSGNECEFSSGVFSGLHVFDLTSCLDASSSSVEAVVVTDKGIYSKKFFVGESYHSRELLPVQLWNVTYDGGNHDYGKGVAIDSSSNIYVTGYSNNNATEDYLTLKYDSNGNQIWNVSYDGGALDWGAALTVDVLGNVYVTGRSNTSVNNDYLTFKYDSNGNQIWNVTYDSGTGADAAYGTTVDTSGNVYVTGGKNNGVDYDILTFKYDSNGDQIWNVTYDGGNGYDWGNDIAVDSLGNVYVTGNYYNGLNYDYVTVKYNSLGNEIWNVTNSGGNGYDWGDGIAVDSLGNVYVTGGTYNGVDYDMLTFKYDSSGVQIWNVTYDSGNGNDPSYGITLDTSGNVYVIGTSQNGVTSDLIIFKYAANGNQIWNVSYDSGNNDGGAEIVLDTSGNIYVEGTSNNGANNDFLTLKYAQE
ncbi:SBBP repeat-containing protein [Candidatus Woesearchaeota archaeon]|nr:SBBP repeat-containing protein [Candidatus Woesearchaeota archaeon]USN43985.1 MAG: SBBP repeat-containing protein [Candidatus Woesearchaeota archaeon]